MAGGGGTAAAATPALHWLVLLCNLGQLVYYWARIGASGTAAYGQGAMAITCIFVVEAIAHVLFPAPHLSVGVMIMVSVVFTILPAEDAARPIGLHMGSVPPFCVLWLGAVGILSSEDLVRALYGSASLRPYHLIVMFLGSVYLCTALERSGFLHTAALRVVEKYGRSPWGLFWALGIFSGCLTVLIPDDIVTMTLTPITIRMCQLLNLPEIPYLFSQFFAGNIWAVTLVTGNPTNVLLAEDLGDTFVSFAGRMGIPGVCAGLVSFLLMWLTNRDVINGVVAASGKEQSMSELTSPSDKASRGLLGHEGGCDSSGSSSGGEAVAAAPRSRMMSKAAVTAAAAARTSRGTASSAWCAC